MNEEELKRNYEIIVAGWKIMKKYKDPVDADEYWEALQQECSELYKKYKTEFTKQLMVVVLSELERISRRNMKEGGVRKDGVS